MTNASQDQIVQLILKIQLVHFVFLKVNLLNFMPTSLSLIVMFTM